LDPKSHLCFFLGYCDNTKGCQLWDPETSNVLIRRDVIFNEQLLYGTSATAPSDSSSSAIFLADPDICAAAVPLHLTVPSCSSSSSQEQEQVNRDSVSVPAAVTPEKLAVPFFLSPGTAVDHLNYHAQTHVPLRLLIELADVTPTSSFSIASLSSAHAHLVNSFGDYYGQLQNPAAVSFPSNSNPDSESTVSSPPPPHPIIADFSPDDPLTFQDALRSPDAAQWLHAMTEDIGSLRENKTWELVRQPDGRKDIKCKWVFKTKYLPSGNVDKFKACLVAKGCTQKAGIDYTEKTMLGHLHPAASKGLGKPFDTALEKNLPHPSCPGSSNLPRLFKLPAPLTILAGERCSCCAHIPGLHPLGFNES
jgi:hypothetical protein